MSSGSTWNRWELHMHTPFTKKNDRFTISSDEKKEFMTLKSNKNSTYEYNEVEHKWEMYITKINEYVANDSSSRNVKVIGITDYCSIDNYKTILSMKDKLSSKIELLLPNVELRLNMSGKNSPINIHCIFNPKIVDELNEIFFAQLKMMSGQETYFATKTSLIKLGKKYSEDMSLSDEYYEKEGISKFTVDFESLKDVFQDCNLRENTIIVVANSSNDGVSGLRGQLIPIKTDIYTFVDAIFSSTPSDINFFSGEKDYESVIKDCGKVMPCFHGSDAHSYEKIFEPDEKRYCYLKSEISFDGLKQALKDPKDRVFIGQKFDTLNKIENTKNKRVKYLSIKNTRGNSWFQNVCMEFNPQLNVIIGNKGNGKTAIGDILSFCGNIAPTEDFKFLSQFSRTSVAKSIKSKITFFDGTNTEFINLSDQLKPQIKRIKYIPQAYFETITNEIEKTEKLRQEVESVIFDYLPTTVRGAYSSFSEYREHIEDLEQGEIDRLRNSLSEVNKNIIDLEDLSSQSYIESLENNLSNQKKALSKHISIKPKEKPKVLFDDENNKKIEALNRWKKKLKTKKKIVNNLENIVSNYIKEKNKIDLINSILDQKTRDILEYLDENYNFLLKYDLGDVLEIEFDSEQIDLVGNNLEKKIDKINRYLEFPYVLQDSYGEASLKGKIQIIASKIEDLELLVSDRATSLLLEQEKLENWKLRKIEIEGEENNPNEGTIKYIESRIKYVKKELPEELKNLREKRLGIVNSIVDCKMDLIEKLEEGVKGLTTYLANNNGNILTIKSELNLKNDFIDKFLDNINQQKISSYQGKIAGREVLENILNTHFSDGITKDKIKHFLLKIDETNEKYERRGEKVRSDLSFIINREELYNYLFSLNYISVEFNLKMGEKPLNKLSPGERGAVLLVFYLLLDKEEIPLIIDQPEDNLDNQSIADILVPYIREAKKKRQIILITHNPNLAVISDSELVIHVEIDKENHNMFSYTSGGIENRDINKKIQDVLEGTPRAFRIRDNKYF